MSYIQFRQSCYRLRDRVVLHCPGVRANDCPWWIRVLVPVSPGAEPGESCGHTFVSACLFNRVFAWLLHDCAVPSLHRSSYIIVKTMHSVTTVQCPHTWARHIGTERCHFKYLSISKLLTEILEGSTEIIFQSKISWHHARLLLLIVPSVCCVDVYWIGIYSLNIGHEESFIYIYSVTPGWGLGWWWPGGRVLPLPVIRGGGGGEPWRIITNHTQFGACNHMRTLITGPLYPHRPVATLALTLTCL